MKLQLQMLRLSRRRTLDAAVCRQLLAARHFHCPVSPYASSKTDARLGLSPQTAPPRPKGGGLCSSVSSTASTTRSQQHLHHQQQQPQQPQVHHAFGEEAAAASASSAVGEGDGALWTAFAAAAQQPPLLWPTPSPQWLISAQQQQLFMQLLLRRRQQQQQRQSGAGAVLPGGGGEEEVFVADSLFEAPRSKDPKAVSKWEGERGAGAVCFAGSAEGGFSPHWLAHWQSAWQHQLLQRLQQQPHQQQPLQQPPPAPSLSPSNSTASAAAAKASASSPSNATATQLRRGRSDEGFESAASGSCPSVPVSALPQNHPQQLQRPNAASFLPGAGNSAASSASKGSKPLCSAPSPKNSLRAFSAEAPATPSAAVTSAEKAAEKSGGSDSCRALLPPGYGLLQPLERLVDCALALTQMLPTHGEAGKTKNGAAAGGGVRPV